MMLSISFYAAVAALSLACTMAAASAVVCIIKGLEQLAIKALYWLLVLSLTTLTLQLTITIFEGYY